MTELRYTIPGDPRTKKNHMMIAGSGGRCPVCGKPAKQWIKQGKAHDEFAQRAAWYLKPRPEQTINRPVNVKCLFYMATRRRVDGLNLLAAIDDLLVSCGILADDNSEIVRGHDGSLVLHDKDHPRVEITITEVQGNGDE